jgi:hypothetical protein
MSWLIIIIAIVVLVFLCGVFSDHNVVALSYSDSGTTIYETNASGERMYIHNNPDSHDPTYQEMVNFILSDDTDRIPYNSYSFVCIDFAVRVHDNAERANITSAVVCSMFSDGIGHALNAFNTTDRGWVYVDCTGGDPGDPINHDKFATFAMGQPYKVSPMTNIGNYYYLPNLDGVVVDYTIFWKNNVNRNGMVTYGFVWPTINIPNIALPSITLPSINWPSTSTSAPTPTPEQYRPTATLQPFSPNNAHITYGDLNGRVVDAKGNGIAHAVIAIYGFGENHTPPPAPTPADDYGYYTINGLAYGDYDISVFDQTETTILCSQQVTINSPATTTNFVQGTFK